MNHKRSWGITALIVFVIAAGGFMYWQLSTVQQLKKQAVHNEKILGEMSKPVGSQVLPLDTTEAEGEAKRMSDNHKAEQVATEIQQANDSLLTGHKADNTPDWHSLPPEQRQQIIDQFYIQFGLKVPRVVIIITGKSRVCHI